MAGIYIHIPFCKKACHYCDFHFSTSLKYKDEMLNALKQEIKLQRAFLQDQNIETIYFGGGTPSLLSATEVQDLLDQIQKHFIVDQSAEITLEANPDDLDGAKVQALRQTDINRFSIGIQSFFNEDLTWMNRAHNASEAESAVKRVQDSGFENITVDLIYGYPLLTDAKWKANIQQVLNFQVPHISSYSMTVEPATALDTFIKKGRQLPMSESQSAAQFIILMESLKEAGFIHYEISNFALPGRQSRHNSNYWKGISYLGIGPSAHSYNGEIRQWNVANNSRYLESISHGKIASEYEILTTVNRINEYCMTSLRTIWGMDMKKIAGEFGKDYSQEIKKGLAEFTEKNWIKTEEDRVTLTDEGKLYADHIASSLFIDEEIR